MSVYFVTGATGAVGSALVPVLLRDPEAEVHLLVRAESEDAARLRLDELHRFWNLGTRDEASARRRTHVVRGDASQWRFGLSDAAYARLAQSVTHIVHAAGAVRMNLPLAEARQSAVGSATRVVRFARDCRRLTKVEIVSTVGVGGRLTTVPETWLNMPRGFHNTYEQAKAEAERLVELASRDLPITVHRPSMVVGDSRTGRLIHQQVFFHLCAFLTGARTLGISPDLAWAELDIVPVDFVANVIAWSSRSPLAAGKVLHTCSGPGAAIPLADLADRVRQARAQRGARLFSLKPLPTSAFRALVGLASPFVPGRDGKALRTLPVFLEYLRSRTRFENHRTLSLLKQAGESGPPRYAQYVDRVLEAMWPSPRETSPREPTRERCAVS